MLTHILTHINSFIIYLFFWNNVFPTNKSFGYYLQPVNIGESWNVNRHWSNCELGLLTQLHCFTFLQLSTSHYTLPSFRNKTLKLMGTPATFVWVSLSGRFGLPIAVSHHHPAPKPLFQLSKQCCKDFSARTSNLVLCEIACWNKGKTSHLKTWLSVFVFSFILIDNSSE